MFLVLNKKTDTGDASHDLKILDGFAMAMKHVIISTLTVNAKETWPSKLIVGSRRYQPTSDWLIEALSRSDEVHGVEPKILVTAYLKIMGKDVTKANIGAHTRYTNVCIFLLILNMNFLFSFSVAKQWIAETISFSIHN